MEVDQRFEKYMNRKQLSDNTKKAYHFYFNKFIVHFPDKNISNITQEVVDEFISDYSRNIVARAVMNHIIKITKRNDIIIEKITGRKKLTIPKYLTHSEIQYLIKKLSVNSYCSARNRIMLILSYDGGLRSAELLGIRFGDFRIKEWLADVSKHLEVTITGKGNIQRIVFIQPKNADRVYAYLDSIKDEIKSKKGGFLKEKIFNTGYRNWHYAVKRMGVKFLNKDINPHTIRHSTASNWIKGDFYGNKAELQIIQSYLGHKDISTTQIYAHIDKGDILQRLRVDE